jgi:Family of unknown function (DUF6494)
MPPAPLPKSVIRTGRAEKKNPPTSITRRQKIQPSKKQIWIGKSQTLSDAFARWASLTNFLSSDVTTSYHCQQRVTVRGCAMSDEAIAAAVERFVKKISFSTQREVERIVRAALASGKIHGHETVTAAVTLSSEKLGLNTTIYSKIEL